MSFDTPTQYHINYYDDCLSATPLVTSPFTPAKSDLQTTGSISFLVPTGQARVSLNGGGGFVNGVLLDSTSDPTQKMTVCVNGAGNIEEIKGNAVSSCPT